MPFFLRHCAAPGCRARAGFARCQDCGRPFCARHVAAVEFTGYRDRETDGSQWTRYVCQACAARTNAKLDRSETRARRRSAVLGF